MSIRFSDNILNNIEGSDFVVRNRVPRSVQIVLLFLAAFDLICVTFYLTDDSGVNFMALFIMLGSIGALCYATFFFLNRFRNLILATEFQTAMLASATQLGTRFCLIVNTEGLIFYVDPGFQKVFSSFIDSGSRTLKELFMFTQASDELKGRVLATLKRGKSDQIMLALPDASGNPISLMVSIDVLPRPRGYFVIRGRDYVEKRAEDGNSPTQEDMENLAALLGKSLYNIEGGMLVISHKGKVEHVNQELEKFLGYGPGEMAQLRLNANNIIYQYVGHEKEAFLLSDYDGQVILKRKNHALISAQAHQRLIGDDNTQTLGISVTLNLKM